MKKNRYRSIDKDTGIIEDTIDIVNDKLFDTKEFKYAFNILQDYYKLSFHLDYSYDSAKSLVEFTINRMKLSLIPELINVLKHGNIINNT